MSDVPNLPTPFQYLAQIETMYAEDQSQPCFICLETGEEIEAEDLNCVLKMPCCGQSVHHDCLETHITGIARTNNKCPHCQATLCREPDLSPREEYERRQEDAYANGFHMDTSTDHDRFMRLSMLAYDVADQALMDDNTAISDMDYWEMVQEITELYEREYPGDQLYISDRHRRYGRAFLNNMAAHTFHQVLLLREFYSENATAFWMRLQRVTTDLNAMMEAEGDAHRFGVDYLSSDEEESNGGDDPQQDEGDHPQEDEGDDPQEDDSDYGEAFPQRQGSVASDTRAPEVRRRNSQGRDRSRSPIPEDRNRSFRVREDGTEQRQPRIGGSRRVTSTVHITITHAGENNIFHFGNREN